MSSSEDAKNDITTPASNQEQGPPHIIRRRRVTTNTITNTATNTPLTPSLPLAVPNTDDATAVNTRATTTNTITTTATSVVTSNTPAAVIVTRTPRGDTPIPPPPTKPDGTLYHFEMRYSGQKYTAYGDDTGQLLNLLIPDYLLPPPPSPPSPSSSIAAATDTTAITSTVPHSKTQNQSELGVKDPKAVEDEGEILRRLTLRILYAVDCQVKLQAMIIMEYEGFDGCTDEETIVLEGPRDKPPIMEFWDAPVPLVLVTTYYDPYTQTPRPLSRIRGTDTVDDVTIIWLDPASETSLLTSLAHCGFIVLRQVRSSNNSPSGVATGDTSSSSNADDDENDSIAAADAR